MRDLLAISQNSSVEKSFSSHAYIHMFKAIGFLIILAGLSHYFTASFHELDRAATESLRTLEVAAVVSQAKLQVAK